MEAARSSRALASSAEANRSMRHGFWTRARHPRFKSIEFSIA
jgi:hypothetical protein